MYMLRYKIRETADLQGGGGGAADLQRGANAPPPHPPLNAALTTNSDYSIYTIYSDFSIDNRVCMTSFGEGIDDIILETSVYCICML